MPRPNPELHRHPNHIDPMPAYAKALLFVVIALIAIIVVYRYLAR